MNARAHPQPLARDSQGSGPAPDILFVTRKWEPATGGMETYCVKLTEKLAEDQPIEVIALWGQAGGMPPGLLALLGFPFIVFASYLRRSKAPDILHLGDMAVWPLALPALLWRGTAIVVSAHGTDVSYPRRGGLRGRLYGAYLRLGSRLLTKASVIANSETTKQAVQESGWSNVEIVRLGTDFSAPEHARPHGRSILFAGRLVRRKGFGWFVREVLPLLPADTLIQVAGKGWDKTEREALDHPQVTFLGPLDRPKLAQAYAEALCVIVPNIELPNGEFEGFGLVACEAASAGGVALAAKTGGLVSAVEDGVTGFLLPSGDAAAWHAKILEITGWTTQQRGEFIRRSTQTAHRVFSWQRVADETRTIYREIAHG